MMLMRLTNPMMMKSYYYYFLDRMMAHLLMKWLVPVAAVGKIAAAHSSKRA
jgi:hypothetical protein